MQMHTHWDSHQCTYQPIRKQQTRSQIESRACLPASKPELVRGLILNDIGPEVAQAGLDRIKSYVGRSAPVTNWNQAAAQCSVLPCRAT